jgi:hypothetical protein
MLNLVISWAEFSDRRGRQITTFAFGASRSKGVQEYAVQPRSVCAKVSILRLTEICATDLH